MKQSTDRRSGDIRKNLRELIDRELTRLPQSLEAMDDSERLAVVLKLIPFVLPKVKPLEAKYDLRFTAGWDDDE